MSTEYYGHRRESVSALLPALPDDARILEVGCGAGAFRSNIGTACAYWGIEPSGEAAALARERLDTVIVATYEEAVDDLPDAYFDVVVCNDVIEHMADPAFFLGTIRRKLRQGGVLVGSVPNVRYAINLFELLVRKDWAYRDSGVLDRTHLRFFTEKSLRRTFEQSGYAVERLEGINGLAARSRSPLKYVVQFVGVLLIRAIASDTRYMQFAFRIRPDGRSG